MGGEGNEQERGGKGPSSKDKGSTLKHLQLLLSREDRLPFPFLKPPVRGTPGVPGAEVVCSPSMNRYLSSRKLNVFNKQNIVVLVELKCVLLCFSHGIGLDHFIIGSRKLTWGIIIKEKGGEKIYMCGWMILK